MIEINHILSTENTRDKRHILIERLSQCGGQVPPKKSRVVSVRYAPNVESEFIIRALWAMDD